MPKKILQISHKPAYPSIDGGCLEIAKMSSFYNNEEQFSLSIFSFATHKHPFNKKAYEDNLNNVQKIDSVFIHTKINFWQALWALMSNRSYNLSRFKKKKVAALFRDFVQEDDYDFIQFESIYTAHYAKELAPFTKAKFILNAPNVEHELWNQYADSTKGIRSFYFKLLAKQLKKEELQIWRNMDAFICISNSIEASLNKALIMAPKVTIPFLIEMNNYEPSFAKNELSFFHIGAMDWRPNLEGINWFLNSIWSKLKLAIKFHLAGKNLEAIKFDSSIVNSHGFVPDAKEFMTQHDVMIVPLLSGSGMRIKIIEAMALGKCVISTTLGAEGIDCIHGESILIANTAQEFMNEIQGLISSPEKANEIGHNARKYIEKNHNSGVLSQKLIPFLNSISNSK